MDVELPTNVERYYMLVVIYGGGIYRRPILVDTTHGLYPEKQDAISNYIQTGAARVPQHNRTNEPFRNTEIVNTHEPIHPCLSAD